jgi:hypothetical protein
MAREDRSPKAQGPIEEVDLHTLRAVQAYGSGLRTTLRYNATAYGFSVAITSAFGLVSSTHAQAGFALQVMLFAAGAGSAFFLIEACASRLFQRAARSEAGSVLMIEGAADVLSILAAVGAAVGLAQVPGTAAWPATAFGTTLVYLLVGGLDVLIARQIAHRAHAE